MSETTTTVTQAEPLLRPKKKPVLHYLTVNSGPNRTQRRAYARQLRRERKSKQEKKP